MEMDKKGERDRETLVRARKMRKVLEGREKEQSRWLEESEQLVDRLVEVLAMVDWARIEVGRQRKSMEKKKEEEKDGTSVD